MSEQYLEERVQRFLDSEVLKGDKEKVLYLRLYNRLRPFKEKKIFSDILAFQFFERDCREDYDSLGFGGLSDVVEQSQIIEEFYKMCKEDESYADYFEQDYNRYKVSLSQVNIKFLQLGVTYYSCYLCNFDIIYT